ncbi:MAG: peroxiredoxin family protein [Phycisphaerae bacterium]|nr:peroxiredoxin family protein [Phycisphaerae bacterium]
MRRKKNNEIFFFAGVIVVIIIIIAMILFPGRKPEAVVDNNTPAEANIVPAFPNVDTNVPVIATENESPVDSNVTEPEPKIALSKVIDAADAWMPCAEHQAWIGKKAPDFTITDIDEKQHSLSSYRGKSVIVTLWAPWYTPSNTELETLIQLRQAVGTDKLMILGVSFDSDVTVRRYVNKNAINFPIISAATQSLPAPYSTGKPLPCSMFITPDGTLKLSAKGTISLNDYQALLIAE